MYISYCVNYDDDREVMLRWIGYLNTSQKWFILWQVQKFEKLKLSFERVYGKWGVYKVYIHISFSYNYIDGDHYGLEEGKK